ncbi:interferon gamma-related-like [Myxocyprinus asiaticus]|uniref:interferon gamma-related-like n=1 Tax=Myxocyprinus asiaticus TaxID=70543 RepID=UPI002223787B|nr:interferon gamma-related-like [Myxocyprinus asiaticus]
MDSWLNIVLMCGLLIVTLQGTNGSRLPQSKNDKEQMLKTNIHHLQEHYNTLSTEWVGKSVFVSYLDQLNSKGSCTCQTVLLEGMLKIYEEIFTDMLNKSENKEVQSDLKNLKRMVQNLRHKHSVEQSVWRELQDIHSIKVKNATVQGGALNDFLMVFYQSNTEKHLNKIH